MCRRSGCGSAGTSLQVAPKAAVISRLDWEGPASWLTRVAVGRVHFLLDCWTETSAFPSLSCHVGLFTEQVTTWRLASSSEGRGACPREREQARAHVSECHGRQSHNLFSSLIVFEKQVARSLPPSGEECVQWDVEKSGGWGWRGGQGAWMLPFSTSGSWAHSILQEGSHQSSSGVSPGNAVAGGSINRNLGSMILEIKTNSKARRKIMWTVITASRMARTQQWFYCLSWCSHHQRVIKISGIIGSIVHMWPLGDRSMISVSFFKLQTFTFLLEVELSQRWGIDCSHFAFVMSGLCLASLVHRKIIVSFTQFSFIARFCCKTLLETVTDKHGLHVAAGGMAVSVEET